MTIADLWTEASIDVEAEAAVERLTRAKVAVASLWPFLSLARTPGEFEHRVALAAESIAERVPVELIEPVTASLREDFALLHTAADDDGDADDEGGEDDGDDKPDWLKEKIGSAQPAPEQGHRVTAYYDEGLGRWVAADDDATAGKGNPWYFSGGPEAGPATGETNQFPTFPLGNSGDPWNPINEQYPMQPGAWTTPPGGEWRESPMNFTPPGGPNQGRMGSRLPFSGARQVGDIASCADCGHPIKRYADGGWGHVNAPDYHEAGPSSDKVHKDWSRSGPEFGRYTNPVTGGHRTAQEGVEGRPGPNPDYFAGGGEGAAGDQQGGFPADVSLPEDANDWMVDQYGAVPPQHSSGTTGTTAYHRYATEENPAPDSDANLGTDFDSSQEAERYRRARAGEDPGSRDSSPVTGARHHSFFDPADPGVRMVAVGEDPFGTDNQFDPQSASAAGNAPAAPPSMTPGGPGAEAMPPIPSGVPQTTSPRQMPGGGGAAPGGMASPVPNSPDPQMARASFQRRADVRERPDDRNPFGTDDPFDAMNWESGVNQRPRQRIEDMRPNGPQNPGAREPIRTVTSPQPGQREEPEEEDERR